MRSLHDADAHVFVEDFGFGFALAAWFGSGLVAVARDTLEDAVRTGLGGCDVRPDVRPMF